MKTCFVSMPVGRKSDAQTGATIDFDRVYVELIAPAIERAGLAIRSWRSGDAGTSIQTEALGAIMSSDILLADITTGNPNVMYELGIRHALNRGPTVLLSAGAAGPPPFYVAFLQRIIYDPVSDLRQPDALRDRLAEALRAAGRRSEGSPLYEFFPELHVDLPEHLQMAARRGRVYPDRVKKTLKRSRLEGSRRGSTAIAEAAEALGASGNADPAAYLDVLRAFRDRSDWSGLIRSASQFPPDLEEDPQVMQLIALALNRRSEPGDQERALSVMRRLVGETGGTGDAESLGIIGRIYKERWKHDGEAEDLRSATTFYRKAFDAQPTDYYTGFNAAALLFHQNSPASDAELGELLPQVHQALQPVLESREPDYWALSSALELAVIERRWSDTADLLQRILASRPPRHACLSSLESLERFGLRLTGADTAALEGILEGLRRYVEDEAEHEDEDEDEGDADL